MTEAERITRALGGKWYSRFGSARCPAHDDKHPSLSLSNGADGRLLLRCHAGCGFAAILDSLRGLRLVASDGRRPETDFAEMARQRTEDAAQAEKREAQALTCWREAWPVRGTLAEYYLRGRGITCDLPDSLRFHSACWHPSARRFPALVALVEGGDRLAVHRTYLRPDGLGKAEAEPARAMLGTVAGGAVRIVEADGSIVVAEGIETALSLASGLLGCPATIWAALSISGLRGLALPPLPGRLTIASDGDEPGRAAGHALATRASGLGWRVSLLPAPAGRDWNDVLQKKGAAA